MNNKVFKNAQEIKREQIQFNKNKEKVKNILNNLKPQLSTILNPNMIDRFISSILIYFNEDKNFYSCTDSSIIGVVIRIAQLGILPIKEIGEIYMYYVLDTKDSLYKLQFMIGYKGLCNIAYKSNQVKKIQAREVYKGDFFDFEYGLNERIEHKPNFKSKEIIYFYSIINLTNGAYFFNVMSTEEVEIIRNETINYKNAKNKSTTIWATNFADMGSKTVLRRTFKYIPMLYGLIEPLETEVQDFSSQILETSNLSEENKNLLECEIIKKDNLNKIDKANAIKKENTISSKIVEENTLKQLNKKNG